MFERTTMRPRVAPLGVVVMTLILLPSASLVVRAQTQSTTVSNVQAAVPPSVAVAAIQPVWDLTVLQTGSFSVTLSWQIEANVPSLQMMVEASDLFREDNPTSHDVPPIPLDTNRPAVISAEHATPVGGGSNTAMWVGPGTPIGAFPTSRTETVTFESSQAFVFRQTVSTQIFFSQQEAIKPAGMYTGRVKIATMIPTDAALGQ
jgi:hypothetical protein